MADESLAHIATAIVDGTPVDWGSASETLRSSDDRELLDGLKLVADLTRARGVHLQPPPDLVENAQLREWGPLRVIERVGHGTFGDVYRAWDTRLDREVALKVLHRIESQVESLPTAIEEGRLLARVSHPNVVTVYGAERIKGQVGVWMEFVHGSTLETELRERGPFPAQRVIDIAIQLGDALAAVHRAGILHRDVKTQNVMRDGGGRLLLTDFGACELLQGPSEPAQSSVGTPLCTAPEVIEGHRATPQSDVYSLGVLLYRLATGRYPVEGRTLEDVRAAHARGTRIPIRDARPDLPESLANLIERAIHPNRARRFQSADELRDGFAALVQPTAARSAFSIQLRILIPIAVLLLAGLSAFLMWREPRPVTIAVLPLQNLGAGANSEEFADGLTTELIRHLATVPGLDVRSRTSSFVFKGRPRNLRDAGRQLQASLLLEGSVHHAGDRIRITAQLVRAEDDTTVWAGTFDRDVSAVATIQDEISRAIVSELRLKLGRSDRRYDIDVATYERYLRARSLSARPDRESLRTAIAFYKEVTATEPGFAPAYAALADAYADLEFWGINFEDTYVQVKAAASKALELNPELPEAHAAMGLVHARDRVWDRARAAFERSIAINPNLSRTRTAHAHWYLFQTGQLARAIQELQTALSHDPLSLDIRRIMAYVQVSAGDYDAALEHSNYVRKVDPNFPLIGLVKSRALLMKGETAEAVAILEAMRPNRAPELGYAYAVTGRRAEAEALATAAANVPLTQAIIYAGLGDHVRAFAALERGAAAGDPKIGGVLTYPEMTALRQDPRYEALRRRLGLEGR